MIIKNSSEHRRMAMTTRMMDSVRGTLPFDIPAKSTARFSRRFCIPPEVPRGFGTVSAAVFLNPP